MLIPAGTNCHGERPQRRGERVMGRGICKCGTERIGAVIGM